MTELANYLTKTLNWIEQVNSKYLEPHQFLKTPKHWSVWVLYRESEYLRKTVREEGKKIRPPRRSLHPNTLKVSKCQVC